VNAADVFHLRRAAAGYALLASQTANPVHRAELEKAAALAAFAARQGDADAVAGGVVGGLTKRLGGIF
jgi:hypothetical protein